MKKSMLAFEQVKQAWLLGVSNGKLGIKNSSPADYLCYMKYWLFWN